MVHKERCTPFIEADPYPKPLPNQNFYTNKRRKKYISTSVPDICSSEYQGNTEN